MINAYQAKRAATKKAWAQATDTIEKEIIRCVDAGSSVCKTSVYVVGVEQMADVVRKLLKNKYSITVRPAWHNKWFLEIRWDKPGNNHVSIPADCDPQAERWVKKLQKLLTGIQEENDKNDNERIS